MPLRLAVLASWMLAASCALMHQSVAIDPGATFGAHLEHERLVIDRLDRGRTGSLEPATTFRLPGAPSFKLESNDETLAFLWLSGSDVTARASDSASGPAVARVEPSWDDGSIRLALEPVDGGALRSDVFARERGGGPWTLTRGSQTVLDVRGVWEAAVRDPHGTKVGWLRVRVSPYQTAPRIYEASLPASASPTLAAAAVASLDAEVNWIESHTVDVYRGDGTGPLERSVPLGR
jgi:hypothetical protein